MVCNQTLAQRLADAADVISRNPAALQLRYLQTLVEIAAEKHSTTIFPIPINTLAPFLKGLSPKQCGNPAFDL
ncbi:MAG: hypothetical protein OEW25_00770 [Nitrospira sp.]|nr:hypothetical protein [Nitrospira sp.]MDH5251829.1 hypothetical protein [Nitrospira sp.]